MGSGKLAHFRFLLAAVTGIHFALITFFSFLRILTYKSSFDLAVFEQVFWSLLHTGIPIVTVAQPFDKLNWFGWHFSPVFYVFLPIYALASSPFTLQLIQCVSLSATAIPTAFALRRLGVADSLTLLLVALLLFNPFYFNAGLWEFHEASLACFFIACGYWALIVRNQPVFILSLTLLLLTKEHFGLSVAGFGFLWWLRYRDGWFGPVVMLCGIVSIVVILAYLMPALAMGIHPMFTGNLGTTSRYGWISPDIAQTFKTLWQLFFSTSISPIPGVIYLFLLLTSVCFLPLFSPFYLLPALSDISAILLSTNSMPRSILAYHSSAIIPVIIIAAGCRPLKKELLWVLFTAGILLQIALYWQYPESLGVHEYELISKSPTINFSVAGKIKTLVKNDSISAQPNIAFLFADRQEIYPFPVHLDKSNFIILYLRQPYQSAKKNPFNALYTDEKPAEHYKKVLGVTENTSKWGIVLFEDNWLVLQKNIPDQLPVREAVIKQIKSLEESSKAP